ncbi:MAG: hypothetical protein IJ578_08560 [Bacteroidales bacterium]|nr:hypothetical protein [Bacteroidales bacterium]
MGRLWDKFRSLSVSNGKDIIIFAMSLLLAFSIWLIHNLSLYYNETVSIPVTARSSLEGHAQVSSNSAAVQARLRLTGFDVIRTRGAMNRKAVVVDFAAADLHPRGGEMFYVTGSDLNRYVQAIFGDDARLETMLSDTVQFRFPLENSKKVPVMAVYTAAFRPQYTAVGDLRLTPDSVTVYGEPMHLAQVDRVYTRPFTLEDLRVSAHGRVRLEETGLRLSVNSVDYALEVSRYVEIRADIPVGSRGVPAGRSLIIYPSVAQVSFKCAFPVTVDPTDNAHFYIDYQDFTHSLGGMCIPRCDDLPAGILDYTIEPQVFDCVESSR